MCCASSADPPNGPPLLIIGLGNPLLADDGVGWRVVEALADRLGLEIGARDPGACIELDRMALGGLTLMERLVGYRRAILVDAVAGGGEPAGTVSVRPVADLERGAAAHLDSSHDAPLSAALDAGRGLGAQLPSEIIVVGIEAARVDTFDERLSPAVAAAVPDAVTRVLALWGGGASGAQPSLTVTRTGGPPSGSRGQPQDGQSGSRSPGSDTAPQCTHVCAATLTRKGTPARPRSRSASSR